MTTATQNPHIEVERIERRAAGLAYRAMNITGNEDAAQMARSMEREADAMYAAALKIRRANDIPDSWHW